MTRTYQTTLTLVLVTLALVVAIAQYGTMKSALSGADFQIALPTWTVLAVAALAVAVIVGGEWDRHRDNRGALAEIRQLQELYAKAIEGPTLAPGDKASVSSVSRQLQKELGLEGRAWIMFHSGGSYFHGNNKIEYRKVDFEIGANTRLSDVGRAVEATYRDQIARCNVSFIGVDNNTLHKNTKVSNVKGA